MTFHLKIIPSSSYQAFIHFSFESEMNENPAAPRIYDNYSETGAVPRMFLPKTFSEYRRFSWKNIHILRKTSNWTTSLTYNLNLQKHQDFTTLIQSIRNAKNSRLQNTGSKKYHSNLSDEAKPHKLITHQNEVSTFSKLWFTGKLLVILLVLDVNYLI